MNDEDWWRLVFDSDVGHLYVEHEWAHVDVRRRTPPNAGKQNIELADFFEKAPIQACTELRQLLERLFK
ncbi:hypothetical protein [Geminicoccus roseus]|uniref:hypothetical protein n=1 Tax=Geminicoccus roseus TaxID=404900 RepID=UPI0012FAB881|nr:hypothetical protein [Geminicoccus roseus]